MDAMQVAILAHYWRGKVLTSGPDLWRGFQLRLYTMMDMSKMDAMQVAIRVRPLLDHGEVRCLPVVQTLGGDFKLRLYTKMDMSKMDAMQVQVALRVRPLLERCH